MLGFLKLIGLVVALVLSPYYWEKAGDRWRCG